MATERRVISSLEMLPEDCQDDVVWALSQLNGRQRTQADILFELNDRLAVKGQGPISRSAFSRRSVRLKRRRDRLEERSAMYAGVADKLTPEKIAEDDIVLGEFIKSLIDELTDEASTPKEALQLSSAYRQLVSGQKISVERRLKAVEAGRQKLDKAVDSVTEEVTKSGRIVDAAEVLRLVRKAYSGD